MHHYRVRVRLEYDADILSPVKDEVAAQEYALDVEDPDYDTPVILECVYLGEVDPAEESAWWTHQ